MITKANPIKWLTLALLLPFYSVAVLFALIAGLIGGRQWRVRVSLEQHLDGQAMAEANIKVLFKE